MRGSSGPGTKGDLVSELRREKSLRNSETDNGEGSHIPSFGLWSTSRLMESRFDGVENTVPLGGMSTQVYGELAQYRP